MKKTNENLFARNFYNRLRLAASVEQQISDGLKKLAKATVGLKPSEIGAAEKKVGPGRVRWVHPDCGFWMLKRNMADGKIRALVAGRDLYEGRTTK